MSAASRKARGTSHTRLRQGRRRRQPVRRARRDQQRRQVEARRGRCSAAADRGLNPVKLAALAGAHPIVAADLVPGERDMAHARRDRMRSIAGTRPTLRRKSAPSSPQGTGQNDRDHQSKNRDRARLQARAAGRHLRAGPRAEREGDDLDPADPFQQGADRLARRRRGAACRHPAIDQARTPPASCRSMASSRTNFRSRRSTRRSTWCAVARRDGCW